jgi:3'-5' exonuclease
MSIEQCSSLCDELSPEAALLEAFWKRLGGGHAPLVVSWNGRGFEVPVLLHRSFLHGVTARPWFEHGGINRYRNYAYRYGDRHIDLMDVMADYGTVRSYGLNVTAEILGLPGKVGGHGSEVAGMHERGELGKIRSCECDCLNLFGIFLRWSLLTGRLSATGFAASIRAFKAFIENQSSSKEHIRAFRDAWTEEALL